MVSKRQRRVKAKRKAREIAEAYITDAIKKIGQAPVEVVKVLELIRQSSKSLPADVQKELFASWTVDKIGLNHMHDMPGPVGVADIGGSSCNDIYENCFEEDLIWASKRLGGD